MKRGAIPWAALSLSMLVVACTGGDIGPEYARISEKESGLLFYGPGLAGGYRHILTSTDGQFVRRTVADYGPPLGTYPRARIFFAEMPPGRQIKHDVSAKETITQWGWFRDKTVETGATGTTSNAMGRIRYAAARVDGVACIVWRQPMGIPEDGGFGTRLNTGYYCKGEGSMMSAGESESLVKLIGHREHGPIAPPQDWGATATIRLTVIWRNESSGLDQFQGVVRISRNGLDGTIQIGPRGDRKCSGPLIPAGSLEGRTVMKWSLDCSDGLTAKGLLRYRHTDAYVIGEGEDSEGRDLALID